MADNNFRSYRSRDPVAREGTDQGPRRGSSDPLAELARLIGKSDPFADPVPRDTYNDERPDEAPQSPGVEWGAHDTYPEEHRPAEERYVTPPPRDEPLLPSFAPAPPQEHAYEDEPPSGARFFSGPAARFNGFREDPPPFAAAAAADNIRYHDDAQPTAPSSDDRPPVLPPRQPPPVFPPPAPQERAVAEIQAAEVGEAYGADDYYDDAPRPRRRRGGLVVVMAVLGLAVLGTAGAFGYRAMFGGSVLPSLPPIIKAGNGPNKIVPGYGDSHASNSAQTTGANTGSSEKLVSREEQPVEIQEAPKTAPRVISTIPISPNPGPVPPGVSGPSPFATAPGAAAPAVAPPVIATQPAPPPPAPAPAASEPKKIHTVTIRSDQSGGADAGAAPAPQHGTTRSAKMSAAKPSAPALAPAPSGSQPLSLAPDSQGDVAAQTPAPAPAPPPAPPRSRAHAAVANAAPAGGAAETASSGGYAVQVSSQRSEADAHAAFRALRNKFPNQLGGREPIVRRADLGAKGIYYRAMVGPFASMEEAAGMCSNLKAAGGTCLVQRN
jgi:hypothetical protein